jgi:hypothetical protein
MPQGPGLHCSGCGRPRRDRHQHGPLLGLHMVRAVPAGARPAGPPRLPALRGAGRPSNSSVTAPAAAPPCQALPPAARQARARGAGGLQCGRRHRAAGLPAGTGAVGRAGGRRRRAGPGRTGARPPARCPPVGAARRRRRTPGRPEPHHPPRPAPQGVALLAAAELLTSFCVLGLSFLLYASAGPAHPKDFAHEDGGVYNGEWRGLKKAGLGAYRWVGWRCGAAAGGGCWGRLLGAAGRVLGDAGGCWAGAGGWVAG